MRARLLELAAEAGIGTEIRNVLVDELYRAQEVFVCNSILGIWPVLRIGDRNITIGNLTRHLQGLLQNSGA
jgi:4-amino-4-deoxychorismate lyase